MNKTKTNDLPYHMHPKVPLHVRQRLLEKVLKKRLALFSGALSTLEASRALEAAGSDSAGTVFEAARYATGDYQVSAAYDEELRTTYESDRNEGCPWALAVARELDPEPSLTNEDVSDLLRKITSLPGKLPVDDATLLEVARRFRAITAEDEQVVVDAYKARVTELRTVDADGNELPF